MGERKLFKSFLSLRISPEILLVATMLLTLMGYWSFLGWPADLASHFKAQYAVIQLICLVIVFIRKRPQWILLALLGLVPNLIEVGALYQPAPAHPQPEAKTIARIRLMQMNVKTENQSYAQAAKAIRDANPDIVSLQEVNSVWLKELGPVLKTYRHSIIMPHDQDRFGIALYSRFPFKKSKVHVFGDKRWSPPSLLAAVDVKGQYFTVLTTHPFPPVTPQAFQIRDRQLFDISRQRMAFGPSLIVIGDLNMTVHSESYKAFLESAELRNASQGYGFKPSWPSFMPPLWITIDHVLTSPDFQTLRYETGPFIGSDHLPVVVELAWKPFVPEAPADMPMEILPPGLQAPEGQIPRQQGQDFNMQGVQPLPGRSVDSPDGNTPPAPQPSKSP